MLPWKKAINIKPCISALYQSVHQLATKSLVKAEIDENVNKAIENGEIKPRRHPGIMKIKTTEVPDRIRKSVQYILRDQPMKTLLEHGDALTRYLLARHAPAEEGELRSKLRNIQQSIAAEHGIETPIVDEDEQERFGKKFKSKAETLLKKQLYSWKPIEYNQHKCMQYLIGRSAAEYAVLLKIFSELKTRASPFIPRSVFDFGSGLGTASWASESVWGSGIKEYFNVDSSADMNDMASLILRGGNANNTDPKGVFYRQFFPTSDKIRYDLVVSAYSLLELPSSASRMETVLKLWNKSQGYLVLVELGTNAGFRVVNEARDFLLHVTAGTHESSSSAHVFSPCPHDLPCPRFATSKIPCNFEVPYFRLSFDNKKEVRKERFSYVVLKKGARSEHDRKWPRVISPTLTRSKHAICRMCKADGQLDEVIFTASKYGKIPYRCAKSSEWGDLLPMTITRVTGADE